MKVFAAFVLVLATLVPTHADTTVQTWQVTAECNPAAFYDCEVPAVISAVFTTEQEPGMFYDYGNPGGPPYTEEPVVMSIVGTFDGLPISFTAPPPGLTDYTGYGWMNGYPNGPLCFGAGGNEYCAHQYYDDTIITGPFATLGYEILLWGSTELPASVPEPPTILLLTVSLLLALMRWAQVSLRELYRNWL